MLPEQVKHALYSLVGIDRVEDRMERAAKEYEQMQAEVRSMRLRLEALRRIVFEIRGEKSDNDEL